MQGLVRRCSRSKLWALDILLRFVLGVALLVRRFSMLGVMLAIVHYAMFYAHELVSEKARHAGWHTPINDSSAELRHELVSLAGSSVAVSVLTLASMLAAMPAGAEALEATAPAPAPELVDSAVGTLIDAVKACM